MITPTSAQWLWLFPAALFIHIIEETREVRRGGDINLSRWSFFSLAAVTLGLLILGIVVAKHYGFPQLLSVGLAAAFFLNAVSHLLNTVRRSRYSAGVITGLVLFMPIATWTLVVLFHTMSHRRFVVGLGIGVAFQAIASILSL